MRSAFSCGRVSTRWARGFTTSASASGINGAAASQVDAALRARMSTAAKVTRKVQTAEEAANVIKSNDRVFIHSVACAPQALIKAMVARHNELRNVEVCHIHTEGDASYAKPEYAKSFRTNAFFVGSNMRSAVQQGFADSVPVFLSQVPMLFERGHLPIDVALLSLSPPDRHGYCSLGPSVDVSLAAMWNAKHVVGQINKNIPRLHGEGLVHISHIDTVFEHDSPMPLLSMPKVGEVEDKIGQHVANLVEDGATLQMGIGAIPDAVLSKLGNHKDLGIHTEMFSTGVIDLVQKGVVTNRKKVVLPHVITASFLFGPPRLWDFVNDNPLVQLFPSEFVNDPAVIKMNPKVTAINSAIEVDITGQVCADSIGCKVFSGFGGQIDFERGAAISRGGKPIIALPSVTKRGESRIVNTLRPGAGVVTTRAHVHWVVTEWGAVNLFGKNVRQRAELMCSIAHPSHRDRLANEFAQRFANCGPAAASE